MKNQKKGPVTIGAEEGKIFSVVGDTYRILVGGTETNGAFAAIDMLIPPNGGPGPHEHAQIEESFYVIDGEIEVKSEFGEYIATKGSFGHVKTPILALTKRYGFFHPFFEPKIDL